MSTKAESSCVRLAKAAAVATVLGLAWVSTPDASAQLGSLVVTITSPTDGSTVSGTVPVSASVTIVGALTVQSVQFKIDGVNLGAPDTSAPYSVPWNTLTVGNGSHTVGAVARDGILGLSWNATPVTVTVSNPPTITGFTPTSGPVGTSVAISGTNFTGATAVAFNGVGASFVVSSATAIQATVPGGATTGTISVTTPGGTATSTGSFTVVASPPAGAAGLRKTAPPQSSP